MARRDGRREPLSISRPLFVVKMRHVRAHEIGEEMKFLMLVCVEPSGLEDDDVAATDEEGTEESGSFPWLDDVVARGIRLDGDRLKSPSTAKTVLVRDGEVLVSDGPFAETKEVICGYDVLECADIDEAVEVASRHPVAEFGKIEVRPFWRG
jgi:hypothetical protein